MEAIAANILLEGLAVNALAQCETPVTLVTTDSREVCPGCIFVAFPGEKFDGHDFAAKALENGALCVVLNHPVEGVPEEKSVICPDSYHAMMVLGANYRSQFHPKVVGVTGSVGKTTTKQMTYAAIAGFGSTIKTEGNQNNELGLPRTLMRLESSTEYAVIEMGMSHAGEIDRLARAARPDVGIITCIGVSHIGNLGSQENICKAKLEICNGLPEGAPLVLNYDDKFLRAAKLPAHVKPVWFSLADENADVCALSIRQEEDGMSFVLEDQEEGTFVVKIPAMGKHNVANALAAYCAATRLGLDARKVVRGIGNFVGALFIVFLVYMAGIYKLNGEAVANSMVSVAAGKVTIDWVTIFFRGILCNIFVCLAVWIGTAGKTVVDKVVGILLPIAAFVACGFEHCVANMYFLPMGAVMHACGYGADVAGADALNAAGIAFNLSAATLGNIVGGAVLIALGYWFVYAKKSEA